MKIVIIGGGLTGLAVAFELTKQNYDVIILEKECYLGGLAASFTMNNFQIPIFYHHIFSQDKITLRFIKEAGLENKMIWKKIKMSIFNDNKFYDISSPLNFIFSDILPLSDKVKFGLLGLHVLIKKDWKDIEGLNAKEWLENKVGKNICKKIFEPLMQQKYNLSLDKISASELAERLSEREHMGKFGYPKGGLQQMIDSIAKNIRSYGGKIITNSPISKIKINNNRIKSISYKNNNKKLEEIRNPDIVINTVPIPVFISSTTGLPKNYRNQLEEIKYCRNICMSIGMPIQLSKWYWINTINEDLFGGIIEHTNLYDGYPFKMAWVFKYAPSDSLWKASNNKIIKLFSIRLKEMFPYFDSEWIRVFRSVYASPLYDINYKKYMPSYTTPIKNLFFAGIGITYPKIRNMNTALESGLKCAEIIKQKHG